MKVNIHGNKFVVDLTEKTCTCRMFDLTGIPCCHVVSAINYMREPVENYVSHWFLRDTYLKCYSHLLEPDNNFWEETPYEKMLPPPITRKLRGRPQRLRRREQWKSAPGRITRRGRTMHCTKCRQAGHNRSKCPNSNAESTELSNDPNEVEKGKGKRQSKESENGLKRVKLPIRRKKGQPHVGFGTFVLPNGNTMFQSGNQRIIFKSNSGAPPPTTNNTLPTRFNSGAPSTPTIGPLLTPSSSSLTESGIRTELSRNRQLISQQGLRDAAAKRRAQISSSQQSTESNVFKRPMRKDTKP